MLLYYLCMRSDKRLLRLADLAESQWGLFTSAQAGSVEVSTQHLKRLADQSLLVRVRHGVYRLAGLPESPATAIQAEWLALEPSRLAGERLVDQVPVGVVSHRSAANLQKLGDLDADTHEFIVPRRRSTRSPDVSFHIGALGRDDWQIVEGLPVTRPLRTVVDLAAARTDGGHLATVVRDAIISGDTTAAELAAVLRPYAHHYGVPVGSGSTLVENFIEQTGVPESALSLASYSDSPDLAGAVLRNIRAGQTGSISPQSFIASDTLPGLPSAMTTTGIIQMITNANAQQFKRLLAERDDDLRKLITELTRAVHAPQHPTSEQEEEQ